MGRVGVIDIGTVTARLGVADVTAGHVDRCSKTSTICNLGEGVAQTGELSAAAIDRVLSCVGAYIQQAREAKVETLCCTLTSAARDAKNSEVLLEGLRALGVAPQVIPGEIEGKLTFLGVAQDFTGQRICVADNGGGSTEIAVGKLNAQVVEPSTSSQESQDLLALEAVKSLNVGCRRVTDLFLKRNDPPLAQDVAEARAFCKDIFARELPAAAYGLGSAVPWLDEPATYGAEAAGPGLSTRLLSVSESTNNAGQPTRLVCVGGTVTTLVSISAELDPYDPTFVHLHELKLAEVDALVERMAALPLEERRCLKGLQPKRAEVILAGSICVSELMRATGVFALTVSESDLLYGLSLTTDAAATNGTSPVGWIPELFRVV